MRTRREFIFGVGKATGAAALGYIALPLLESCLPTSAPLVPAPTSIPLNADGTITVDVSTLTQANPEMVVADFTVPTGPQAGFGVIVTLTPDGTYHALSMKCTHLGCAVNGALTDNEIYCSCHGSEFDLNGNVVRGPATTPLISFTIKPPVTGPILTIQIV
jgi:Rieske Fe-S protein